jgi:hypothetical protein
MSCESLWHSLHRTFHHDVGRIPIGGGVGGARKLFASITGSSDDEVVGVSDVVIVGVPGVAGQDCSRKGAR